MTERSQLAGISLPACTPEKSRQGFDVISTGVVIVQVGPPTEVLPIILDEFIAFSNQEIVGLAY